MSEQNDSDPKSPTPTSHSNTPDKLAGDAPTPPSQESQNGEEVPDARSLALRTIGGLLLLFVVVAIGAYFLKDTLEKVGVWFVANYGLPGMFVGTYISDTIGIPVPVDTYLVAAVSADVPTLPVLAVASAASILGGQTAYLIGRNIERVTWLRPLWERYRPRGEAVFKRWGVAAVAVAAWTPVPFSFVCIFAGTFRMKYSTFFLTTLNRIPRIILYYYVIVLGWLAGSS